MTERTRALIEKYDEDELVAAIDREIAAAFRAGFEHAVAGGDEAAKKHGIDPATLPLVMYFANEADRREMIDAVAFAKPGMVEIKIPEPKR